MALVAYSDDSDLESDSEEVKENINGVASDIKGKLQTEVDKNEIPPGVSSNSFLKVQNQKVHSSIDDIVDEDENLLKDKSSLLASIPAAIPVGRSEDTVVVNEVEDELTDVPTVDTWKVTVSMKKFAGGIKQDVTDNPASKTKSTFGQKKPKNKVKIFVPALSEFDDDEDEEEPKDEPERKKAKPSAKGTGLFSVLPEPKHISVKETKRALIPHVLTKPPPTQKPSKPKPVVEKKTKVVNDSDEEDAGPSDFFSLFESVDDTAATMTVPVPDGDTSLPIVHANNDNFPKPESTVDDARKTPESERNFQVQAIQDPSDIDQDAMLRLMGKRRGKGEEINFIDVSADDALLTRDEWMTKSLTEEKPSHSFSKKREGLPSQKQKQKHQITYLAHQAKERELELKNNWAQNRVTKMQTQAKYGF